MVVDLGTKDERVLGGCAGVDIGVLAVTSVEEAVMARRKRRAQRRKRVDSLIGIVGFWEEVCLGGVSPALILILGQNREDLLEVVERSLTLFQVCGFRYMLLWVALCAGCWGGRFVGGRKRFGMLEQSLLYGSNCHGRVEWVVGSLKETVPDVCVLSRRLRTLL